MSDPYRHISRGTGEGAQIRNGGRGGGTYADDDDDDDDENGGIGGGFYADGGEGDGGDHEDAHEDNKDPMVDLSRRVSSILVGAEELRRHQAPFRGSSASYATSAAKGAPVVRPNTGDVVRWRIDVEHLCDGLGRLHDAVGVDPTPASSSASAGEPLLARPHPNADIAKDLWRSCHQRVLDVADETFRISLGMREPSTESETNAEGDAEVPMEALRQDGQAAIARILELLLGLVHVASQHHQHDNRGNKGDDGGGAADAAAERADHVVASYVQYQRQVYRHRAKSCVAELVQARQRHQQLVQDWEQLQRKKAAASRAGEAAPSFRVLAVDEDDHDEDERGDGGASAATDNARHVSAPPVAASVHHAAAIANLLGMAAQLIHPLLSWRNQLEYMMQQQQQQDSGRDDPNDGRGGVVGVPGQLCDACTGASRIVHEQAALLVETVASWMADDHTIDEWMGRSASGGHEAGGDVSQTGSSSLQGLDGLVEELAYSCHVVRRYLVLVRDLVESDTDSSGAAQHTAPPSPLETLLHEWTWKYASLERHLAVQNWHAALDVAQPTTLVLGTSIRVPSFVEDGHYLSLRALQRAAGTAQSALAVGTVAHALSHDVWSTEDPIPPRSVHDALTNRHGCDPSSAESAHAVGNSKAAQPPRSEDFASAFLDALDQDVHRTESTSPNSHRRRPPTSLQPGGSAPSSGNFLSLIGLDLNGDGATRHRRLDVEFCFLNGIHAAGTACRELVAFLDSLLAASPPPNADQCDVLSSDDDPTLLEMDAKSLAMIQLAREELFRSAQSYDEWLAHVVTEQVQQNSQSLVVLRDFFLDENYALTSSTIGAAESDDRLERDMMGPLKMCPFLSQLSHKLDADVCRRVGDELVHVLVDKVILQVLWTDRDDEGGNGRDPVEPKRFTELGALLLSKQVRMLQGLAARVVSNPELGSVASASISSTAPFLLPNFAQWERLSQVLTALQLEKPSDWLLYRYQSSSNLSPDELRRTLLLRTDFSREAISAVVNQVVASVNQTLTA
jgi:hypothetical protein